MLVVQDVSAPLWQLLLAGGALAALVSLATWIGKGILLWRQRVRFEMELEGDRAGNAKVTITNLGKTSVTLREVRVVVRKSPLYRTLYLVTHLWPVRTVRLAAAPESQQLTQNTPHDIRLKWKLEHNLPPRSPWQTPLQKKYSTRRWEEKEIRVLVLIAPRRFSGYHKLKWASGGFAPES